MGSINLTHCGKLHKKISATILVVICIYSVCYTYDVLDSSAVTISSAGGQSAGMLLYKHTSETKRQAINNLKTNKKLFYEWFVGIVDGDGTFSITPNKHNNSWQFSFKLSLHVKDKPLLALIKKQLGCGSINYAGKNNWQFRIRDRSQLLHVVIPIFLNYPLHTRKIYHFELFHQALLDSSKCVYLKSIWNDEQALLRTLERVTHALPLRKPSTAWIIGFIEAEGSFYVVQRHKPSNKRPFGEYCHGFSVTQKHDKHIVDFLKQVLHIQANPRFNQASSSWSLDTTNRRSIDNIVKYFNNTILGSKHLEFTLWSRAYLNKSKCIDMQYMKNLQNKLQSLRKIVN
ncbi:putative LAGLIDADG endonuclease (mitochondrion) [Astrephomene gubernaculifera]|nr:putative LAGLIDADG endonuclease [Astrephomene gubernaculifera]